MVDIESKPEPVVANPDSHTSDEEKRGSHQDITKPEQSWATRNGLNLSSFTAHDDHGTGTVELERRMKPRHLNMIAIGGSIGAGFFVGSGGAFNTGGPGSVLIGFLIMGVMMFNVVYALGELAVMYPVSGGFYTYANRFVDPSWGFAMGWNYVMQWAFVLPLELTVCGTVIQYWAPDTSVAIWVSVFLVAIIIINIFGTLGYAEEEFWASLLKLSATVIFMIVAVVLVCGGGPSDGMYDHYWGARLWHDPGAFKNGFRGFCGVFVTAAFSFSGTELVGLAAAESENPAKALPGAIKQVFWRITLFYVVGLFLVGLLVSSTDPRLLNAGNDDPSASPFVIAVANAGLKGYDSFMNVIILVSVLSIGVSCVYGGSRTLVALAQQGYAPKFFAFIDKSGRPLPAVSLIIAIGFLGYLSVDGNGNTVFTWLLSLSGLAALFTWGSICLCHIRFRQAWKYHGHTLDEIPFQAIFGVVGSWIGLALNIIILIAQFYTAITNVDGSLATAEAFFESYLAAPVVIAFYIGGYLWKREGWLKLSEVDLDTGRREHDWDAIHAYREQLAAAPAWKRMLKVVF
ncbi:amino acid permease/ SLC12A domain-containing protein [Dactylonectria estremocensis]|uniref:Amino acid permease/ SLC12A domain-containing protein n=1 Tax=Dactylonectria estremocensis TaxID=1079267 RepID=A0A9P9F091_9HYPO|nr:amino acid permease/ SLC12A domain-containing protein [Dactylonectria estremocensis]